jgi:hypothetical protein
MVAALALAVCCGVSASAEAGAAKKHRACPKHGGHTLIRSRSARIWYTGLPGTGGDGASYYGCLGSTRKVRRFAQTDSCFHQCDLVGKIRLSGRYVAWELDSSFSYGGGTASTDAQSIGVYDLKAGRQVTTAGVYSSSSDPTVGTVGAPVASLLLAPGGAAVALLGATGHYTLGQIGPGATTPTTLDSGAIDAASLKLSAGVLTWTNAGVQHSQPL